MLDQVAFNCIDDLFRNPEGEVVRLDIGLDYGVDALLKQCLDLRSNDRVPIQSGDSETTFK